MYIANWLNYPTLYKVSCSCDVSKIRLALFIMRSIIALERRASLPPVNTKKDKLFSVLFCLIVSSYTCKNLTSCIASLPTSRQQVVFALLVPSCLQVWNKLVTTCNKLDGVIRLVARLFEQMSTQSLYTCVFYASYWGLKYSRNKFSSNLSWS
jgi:hypothetical protein